MHAVLALRNERVSRRRSSPDTCDPVARESQPGSRRSLPGRRRVRRRRGPSARHGPADRGGGRPRLHRARRQRPPRADQDVAAPRVDPLGCPPRAHDHVSVPSARQASAGALRWWLGDRGRSVAHRPPRLPSVWTRRPARRSRAGRYPEGDDAWWVRHVGADGSVTQASCHRTLRKEIVSATFLQPRASLIAIMGALPGTFQVSVYSTSGRSSRSQSSMASLSRRPSR